MLYYLDHIEVAFYDFQKWKMGYQFILLSVVGSVDDKYQTGKSRFSNYKTVLTLFQEN